MRRGHFEMIRPVCPVCRRLHQEEHPLAIGPIREETEGIIVEATILCPNSACLREYPVIDGVPLLIPNIREYVEQQILTITGRSDLSSETESLIGDCAGPNSPYDVARQHLSNYGSGHYGDLGPDPTNPDGNLLEAMLETGLRLVGECPRGPALDIGCSVGRASFELAKRTGELVLGVDISFGMLRLAQRILIEGVVSYPLRAVGVVYDRREFPVEFEGAGLVDFWACDACALPLKPDQFALCTSLNLLDCVADPREHLASIATILTPGGAGIVACPYDWSPGATAMEGWLGGHSQRGEDRGRSEPTVRSLLTPGAHRAPVAGLELIAEEERVPWEVRLHDRSTMRYEAHLLALRAAGD